MTDDPKPNHKDDWCPTWFKVCMGGSVLLTLSLPWWAVAIWMAMVIGSMLYADKYMYRQAVREWLERHPEEMNKPWTG